MALSAESRIASAFEDIPQVESVYVRQDASTVSVSIFINDPDEEAYHQIYTREIDMEKRSREINFDFSVIARRNRPIAEFVGSETATWKRRAPAA